MNAEIIVPESAFSDDCDDILGRVCRLCCLRFGYAVACNPSNGEPDTLWSLDASGYPQGENCYRVRVSSMESAANLFRFFDCLAEYLRLTCRLPIVRYTVDGMPRAVGQHTIVSPDATFSAACERLGEE